MIGIVLSENNGCNVKSPKSSEQQVTGAGVTANKQEGIVSNHYGCDRRLSHQRLHCAVVFAAVFVIKQSLKCPVAFWQQRSTITQL